jgi:hypothetical protein
LVFVRVLRDGTGDRDLLGPEAQVNVALQRNSELLKQNRDALVRRGLNGFVNTASNPTAQNGTVSAGARVFDSITGEEGEVVHVARENVVVRAAK